MKVGLCSVILQTMSFEDIIKWTSSVGINYLEVPTGSPVPMRFPGIPERPPWSGQINPPKILKNGAGSLKKTLKDADVTITSLFYFGVNNLNPDLKRRKQAVDGLKTVIEACAELDIDYVTTGGGSPHKRPPATVNPWGIYYHAMALPQAKANREEGVRIFAEIYGPLCDFAGDRGVKIALEPSSLSGGAGSVANSPEMFDMVFDAVKSPNLGICLDPSHFNWQQADYIEAARKMANNGKVFLVHGKDNEVIKSRLGYVGMMGDGWWRHRLPGWGDINWPKLIHTLQENGYDYVINIEHEDPLYGGFGRGVEYDLEKIKEGLVLSKNYLVHSIEIAGR